MDNQPLSPDRGGDVAEGLPGLWADRYDRPLERSACVGCPFQSHARWVETKRRWPELFAEAVQTDANLRGRLAFAKEPYLHPLRLPLAEAVMLDEDFQPTDGRTDSATRALRRLSGQKLRTRDAYQVQRLSATSFN